MQAKKSYFFTIDDQPFSFQSSVVVTNIPDVSYPELPLLLSMLDANISSDIFTVRYSPKNSELLIYAKEQISFFGWKYKNEIKRIFSGPYQKDFAYSIKDVQTILNRTVQDFSTAIAQKEKEYEHFLKQENLSTYVLFIRPDEEENLVIATGKMDGTAEKTSYCFEQFANNPILFQLWQLYHLKNNYELLQMRKTNYSDIKLGIEHNELFFEVSLHKKTWRIFAKDLPKWIRPEVYERFISTLKIYPLPNSNWLDDALLLMNSSQEKRSRIRTSYCS